MVVVAQPGTNVNSIRQAPDEQPGASKQALVSSGLNFCDGSDPDRRAPHSRSRAQCYVHSARGAKLPLHPHAWRNGEDCRSRPECMCRSSLRTLAGLRPTLLLLLLLLLLLGLLTEAHPIKPVQSSPNYVPRALCFSCGIGDEARESDTWGICFYPLALGEDAEKDRDRILPLSIS